MEGETSETQHASTSAQHPSVAGMNPTQLNPYAVNALQSLAGNQQLPFLDSNALLMTNAAAIAAVAASAVQQMNQGKSSSAPQTGAPTPSAMSPALLAALRGSGLTSPTSNAISPHIAALLGGGGGAHSALQIQGNGAVPPHLHQMLGHDASNIRSNAASSALATGTTTAPVVSGTMHGWKLEQLGKSNDSPGAVALDHELTPSCNTDKHVSLLQRMNKPVPQSVALLLADARRKEKKKTAKRAANRKSASTSRARKKALVEEMTRTNARLKRQALILELLPDLVIATNLDGVISFCSAQVENVLKHKHYELLGASLNKLLVPASRDIFTSIIKELKDAKTQNANHKQRQGRRSNKRRHDDKKDSSDRVGNENPNGNGAGNGNNSGMGSQEGKSAKKVAAIVSERSFPLSIVNVESKQSARLAAPAEQSVGEVNINVNSDNSTSNNSGSKQQVSSLSNATGLSRSPNESQSEDDGAQGGSQGRSQGSKEEKHATKGKQHPSSDESSLSSEAKNMRKAYDNLDRNVRWHNQRMMEDIQKANSADGPKDDVTGASVTANNASARLSSLQHMPELQMKTEEKDEKTAGQYENNGDQSSSDDSLLAGVEEKKKVENQSDDSGYRESNDSREETSSSSSDSSNLNGKTNARVQHTVTRFFPNSPVVSSDRKTSLIPTYRLCLIRDDLTTVWCEVTSSLRKQAPDEDPSELLQSAISVEQPQSEPEVTEVLLCLRPIRDGEKNVDESLRFVSPRASSSDESVPTVQVSSPKSSSQDKDSIEKTTSGNGSNSNNSFSSENASPKGLTRKRPLDKDSDSERQKKRKGEGSNKPPHASETEKSVVESLMLMNKSSQ